MSARGRGRGGAGGTAAPTAAAGTTAVVPIVAAEPAPAAAAPRVRRRGGAAPPPPPPLAVADPAPPPAPRAARAPARPPPDEDPAPAPAARPAPGAAAPAAPAARTRYPLAPDTKLPLPAAYVFVGKPPLPVALKHFSSWLDALQRASDAHEIYISNLTTIINNLPTDSADNHVPYAARQRATLSEMVASTAAGSAQIAAAADALEKMWEGNVVGTLVKEVDDNGVKEAAVTGLAYYAVDVSAEGERLADVVRRAREAVEKGAVVTEVMEFVEEYAPKAEPRALRVLPPGFVRPGMGA